jgi:hypothetical protein
MVRRPDRRARIAQRLIRFLDSLLEEKAQTHHLFSEGDMPLRKDQSLCGVEQWIFSPRALRLLATLARLCEAAALHLAGGFGFSIAELYCKHCGTISAFNRPPPVKLLVPRLP